MPQGEPPRFEPDAPTPLNMHARPGDRPPEIVDDLDAHVRFAILIDALIGIDQPLLCNRATPHTMARSTTVSNANQAVPQLAGQPRNALNLNLIPFASREERPMK